MQQEISVVGVEATVRTLQSFSRETWKAVNKEIYQEVKPLVNIARSLVPEKAPMSGWAKPNNGEWGTRLLYEPGKVKMGIRTKIGTQRQQGTNTKQRTLFLAQANAAGAIYETAGRKTKGKGKQGQQFIKNLEDPSRDGIVVIGKQSRIIWGVVQDNRKKIVDNVERVIYTYTTTYNQRLAA